MLLQAYRGVSAEYPENTYSALLAAAEQDYPLVEVDVTATADGALVLMSHTPISCLAVPLPAARSGEDKLPSIGGSADFGFHTEPFTVDPVPDVDAPVLAGDLSYEALLGWDFGTLRGRKHRNTPICTLAEALEFAAAHHLGLQLNLHHISGPAYARLIPMLRERRDVSLCFEGAAELRQARRAMPQLPLHYRGPQDAEALEALGDMERLTVWFAPDASDETVEKVRAKLPRAAIAAGPATDHSQLDRWRTLGATVVSTAGQLKPVKDPGVLADMHVHSENSHDARVPVMKMCRCNIEAGVTVVNIADHCDLFLCDDAPDADVYSNLRQAWRDVQAARQELGDRCRVLMGVELGESIWYPVQCEKVLDLVPYDCVVASVHAVRCRLNEGASGLKLAYSQFPWKDMTEEEAGRVFQLYFEDLLETVRTADMDVAAHLTVVSTYFNRYREEVVDMHPYEPLIRQILAELIRRGIALEVNTGCVESLGITRPEEWILALYRDMGGYLITLATDSHDSKRVRVGYDKVIQMLKKLGFHFTVIFENRRIRQITL